MQKQQEKSQLITYQIYSHNQDHRQIIAPVSQDKSYYTNLNFSPQFQIKVFVKRQPKTMRLSMGIAGQNQSNALRFMVNHVWGKKNDPNFYENPNNKMTIHGWTDYGEFYAFKEYQQGTTLMKAFEFSNPHRLILTCNETEIKAYENQKDANLVEQFYAYYIPKEMTVDQDLSNQYQEEIQQLEKVAKKCEESLEIIQNKNNKNFPEIKSIYQQTEDIQELVRDALYNLELLSDQTFIKVKSRLQNINRILEFVDQIILPVKNLKYKTLNDTEFTILNENIQEQKSLIEQVEKSLNNKYYTQMQSLLEQQDNLVLKEKQNIQKQQSEQYEMI